MNAQDHTLDRMYQAVLGLERPTLAVHAHLRDGGWPLCRLNAFSSRSWGILEFPSGKYSFKGVLISVWLYHSGLSSETLLSLGLSLWDNPWLLEVAFGFSIDSSFS